MKIRADVNEIEKQRKLREISNTKNWLCEMNKLERGVGDRALVHANILCWRRGAKDTEVTWEENLERVNCVTGDLDFLTRGSW